MAGFLCSIGSTSVSIRAPSVSKVALHTTHNKVYNKNKPSKWGIKVFVLCDAVNGYVCELQPYMGAQTTYM